MKFERLQRRVERAEQLVEGRALQTQAHWSDFKTTWRQAWTPGRIIVAGLVTGFLSGRAEPLRAMTGAKWLQMVGSLSSLFASVQAATAAEEASSAADQASDAADTAEAVHEQATGDTQAPLDYPEERLVDEPYDAGERVVTQPRPAEAATELSER